MRKLGSKVSANPSNLSSLFLKSSFSACSQQLQQVVVLYSNIIYCFAFIEVLTASRISFSLRPYFIIRKKLKDFQRLLVSGIRSSTIELLQFRGLKFCSFYFREYYLLKLVSSTDPDFFLGHPVYCILYITWFATIILLVFSILSAKDNPPY